MERLNHDVDSGGDPAAEAVRIAEDRTAWPTADDPDWEEGPDPLRYPDLYNDPDPADEGDDLEPLDLDEHRTSR